MSKPEWWSAPPADLSAAQGRRLALDLIGAGAHFNTCQLDFLWYIALRRRPLTERHRRVMGALRALAATGQRGLGA